MGFLDICAFRRDACEAREAREASEAKEMKECLEASIRDFLKLHCKFKPHYITPIGVLNSAWVDYCKTIGIAHKIHEYRSKDYHKKYGAIDFTMGQFTKYPFAPSYLDPPPTHFIGVRLESLPLQKPI